MKEITFSATTLSNQEIDSRYVKLFYFTGKNHSDKQLKILSSKPSCGCTTSNLPEVIEPDSNFTNALTVNKIGQKGHYSLTTVVTFSNKQVFDLKLNGTLK